MTITNDDYRAALRRHPAGVTIITLASPAGPVGFTATSLASLSLSPPLVCFNITHTSSSVGALRQANSLVVHLLGEHQLDLARRFSRDASQRFADPASWSTLATGEPVLTGTPTWLRAIDIQLIEAGDSTLVVARVAEIHRSPDNPAPLLYHDGQFTGASRLTG
ncbi:MAG: flavin reductase family protein [Actinobacteria bacterium]|nr:flavin reductase family protein [Actinomycetota bacterium]